MSTEKAHEDFFNDFCNQKVLDNLVDAMNIFIQKMEDGDNKIEKSFLKSIEKNFTKVAKPFLFYDKKSKKIKFIKKGGSCGPNHPNGPGKEGEGEKKCQLAVQDRALALIHQQVGQIEETDGIAAIGQNITQTFNSLAIVNREINKATLNKDWEAVQTLTIQAKFLNHNLNQAVEHRERLQQNRELIRNEKWKYLCGQAVKLFFVSLAAIASWQVIVLIDGVAELAVGGAGAIIILIATLTLEVVSRLINGISANTFGWFSRNHVLMDSGADIVNNFTATIQNSTQNNPQMQYLVSGFSKVGGTVNILGFIVIFLCFMLFTSIARIFANANEFSVSLLGIGGLTIGQGKQNNNQRLLEDASHTNFGQPIPQGERKTQLLTDGRVTRKDQMLEDGPIPEPVPPGKGPPDNELDEIDEDDYEDLRGGRRKRRKSKKKRKRRKSRKTKRKSYRNKRGGMCGSCPGDKKKRRNSRKRKSRKRKSRRRKSRRR